MRDALEKIDEIILMILTKNIEYNPNNYINKETKLDIVEQNVKLLERYM